MAGEPLELTRDGEVFLLRLDSGENRFHPGLLDKYSKALDEVERAGGPAALVTTGSGRFYSNGLDLEWMTGPGRDEASAYLGRVLQLLARVLTFPTVTVAAVNGHAFGAGGQLALAHDYRVMRRGRGYFCMPEIDMRAWLHPGMTALIQARLTGPAAHEVIATGRRYTAEDALARGIVDRVADEAEVVPLAKSLAAELAVKAHPILRRLKEDMYPAVLEALRAEVSWD